VSNLKIAGLCTAVFGAAFLVGSLVSYLIEGIPHYRESAISGLIIAGLMALQLRRSARDRSSG